MGSKFGIILAFLLSIAAAGGTYYLYQNLVAEKVVRFDLEQKYDETREKVLNLQSEKEQIKAAKEQFESENEEYQRKAQSYESQMNQLKIESARAVSVKSDLEQQLQDKEAQLAEMEKKIVELKRQAEEAMKACNVTPSDIRSSLPAPVPAASSQAQETLVFTSPSASSKNAPAAVPSTIAGSSVASSSENTSAAGTSVASVPASIKTGAKVLTVNRKFNFVVVNLGLKDGLKMGDQLKVVKNGMPSATLQIEKLYDKFAAATIISEDAQNPVMEGDEVLKA